LGARPPPRPLAAPPAPPTARGRHGGGVRRRAGRDGPVVARRGRGVHVARRGRGARPDRPRLPTPHAVRPPRPLRRGGGPRLRLRRVRLLVLPELHRPVRPHDAGVVAPAVRRRPARPGGAGERRRLLLPLSPRLLLRRGRCPGVPPCRAVLGCPCCCP